VLAEGGGELAGRQAGFGPGGTTRDIDVDRLERRQVEEDAAVGRAVTGGAVAAASDREVHPGLASDVDDGPDIVDGGDLDDDRRAPVEDRVEDLKGGPVVRVRGLGDGAVDGAEARVDRDAHRDTTSAWCSAIRSKKISSP